MDKHNKTWDDFYSSEATLSFFLENICVHRPFIETILKENPRRLLEVGSGTGTMSVFLSFLGIKCISIDNSNKILEKAEAVNKRFSGNALFQKADAFHLPFQNRSFDIVFSQGFFEHFSDDLILELIKEQLRVGKQVVLSVPNNFYPQKDLGNERLLPKKCWDKLLSSNFTLIYSENYYYVIPKKIKIILKKWFKEQPVMYMAKLSS